MTNAPLLPEDVLNMATVDAISRGIRILQGAVMAPTDVGHVSALLTLMAPPEGSLIADIGCGLGEVAKLMRAERPDLDFILVNKNALQLSFAPDDFRHVLADMHDMPIETASVDGAMFCYSLCHADFRAALGEAARITKPGGFLFVYDYERVSGTDYLFETLLAARALSRENMTRIAMRAGWEPVSWEQPYHDDTPFREAYANDDEYDRIFRHLRLCAWKMVRV